MPSPPDFPALRTLLDDPDGKWPLYAHATLEYHRAAAEPWLLAQLDAVVADPEAALAGFLPFHLVAMAGRWHLTAAHDALLRLLALPPDDLEALLGDFVNEGFDFCLAATWPEGDGRLLACVQDAALDETARTVALDAVVALVQFGRLPRATVLDALRPLARERAAAVQAAGEVDDYLLAACLLAVAELGGTDLVPEATAWFAAGLPETAWLDLDGFLELANESADLEPGAFPTPSMRDLVGWVYDARDAPGDDDDAPPDDEEPLQEGEFYMAPPLPGYVADAVGTVRREAPKVGRNDPCPCGSGRKSKKCCGG